MEARVRSSIRSLAEWVESVRDRYARRRAARDALGLGGQGDGFDPQAAVRCFESLAASAEVWRFRVGRPCQAPAIVGLFGGTGTGKSTLLNALVGKEICHTSPIRPNTAGPVLYVHRSCCPSAADSQKHLGFPVVSSEEMGEPPYRGQFDRLVLVPHDDERFRGVGLLDCPDIDSFEEQNRTMARRVLGYLDAILLVAIYEKLTQREYAEVLAEVNRQCLWKRVVLNKVDVSEHEAIGGEALGYLADRGWKDAPILVPRMAVDELSGSTAVGALRELAVDASAGPWRMEAAADRWPAAVRTGLAEPAEAFAEAASREREQADQTIADFEELLPATDYDLRRFTVEAGRQARKQSWLYQISLRQVWDHVDYVKRRVGSSLRGKGVERPAHAGQDAETAADQAGQYLATQVRNDLDALYVALEDRAQADPLAREILCRDGQKVAKLDPEPLERMLERTVGDMRQLIENSQADRSWNATKTLRNFAKRIGLPIQHACKMIPYLVAADMLLAGGAVSLIQGAGFAVFYEAGNLAMTFLTDDVRRESKRIAQDFHVQYREFLSDQIRAFTDGLNAGLASAGQLAQLRQSVAALKGELGGVKNRKAGR